MNRFITIFVSLFFVSLLGTAIAPATRGQALSERPDNERRVALVIGNSKYLKTTKLRNPIKDARALASRLERLGFEVVSGFDLSRLQLEKLIRTYTQKLSGADVGLFFFAGHGLQVKGENFLVPVDAEVVSEDDLEFTMVRLNTVLKRMERHAKTSLVFLDACRDNPITKTLTRSMGNRGGSVGRGLAPVKFRSESMIVFATQPGHVAKDGTGENSPFTAALLDYIEKPGLDVAILMRLVRARVKELTMGSQVPWDHSSLTRSFRFNKAVAPLKMSQKERGIIAKARLEADDTTFELAMRVNTRSAYRGYVKRFEKGRHLKQVKQRLGKLEQLAQRWRDLRASQNMAALQAFLKTVENTEFAGAVKARLALLSDLETAQWNKTRTDDLLAGYSAFLARWPSGSNSAEARQRLKQLAAIEEKWKKLSRSRDKKALRRFIKAHGGSEFGADATARLAALERESTELAGTGDASVRPMQADAMAKLLDGALIRFTRSGETITFNSNSMPRYRKRLGRKFLRKLIPEKYAAEGVFKAVTLKRGRKVRIEGLAGIIINRIDKSGQLFMLQMHGDERSARDVDRRDRKFATLQIIRLGSRFVCDGTYWHSLLSKAKPPAMTGNCEISLKKVSSQK